jgi:hypothetical protein
MCGLLLTKTSLCGTYLYCFVIHYAFLAFPTWSILHLSPQESSSVYTELGTSWTLHNMQFIFTVFNNKGPIQVTYSFWLHSTTLRCTQSLTEMRTKEIPWGHSAAGTYSWQLCHPSCTVCQSKDGSWIFLPSTGSSQLLMGKFFYLFFLFCTR